MKKKSISERIDELIERRAKDSHVLHSKVFHIRDGNYGRIDFKFDGNHVFQCRFTIDSIENIVPVEETISWYVDYLLKHNLISRRSLPELKTTRKAAK
jgi:hypothetical protein